MRKLTAIAHVTLDGLMQSPGASRLRDLLRPWRSAARLQACFRRATGGLRRRAERFMDAHSGALVVYRPSNIATRDARSLTTSPGG